MPILSSQLFSVLLLAAFSLSAAADVRVVTDRGHPVKATDGARVVELDLPARIKAELSSGLPADPVHAEEIARQRVSDRELQRRLRAAWQGVAEARSLNVLKIPAVVVDRRYVVYGEPDVSRALARIETYRSARP
jgi:integrating conjugative element protein (TIGR03757 family)